MSTRERPGGSRPGPAAGPDDLTYRGVHWQRNRHGRLRWYNDDAGAWVLYRPGQDAPPRPPRWAAASEPVGTPLRDRRVRKGWRSPYRLVPVVLVGALVIVGVVQAATHLNTVSSNPSPVATEKAAAQKLLGKCLVADAGNSAARAGGTLAYRSQPVPCGSPQASVKVVEVLAGTPGSPSCPHGTSTIRLQYPGVSHPHRLCLRHLAG